MNSITKNASPPKGLLGQGWVRVIAGIAMLLALLLVLTPYLMSWSAKDWLLENGADHVEVQDIDFNPFTGVVVVKQLKVRADDRDTLDIPRLLLDIDWGPLFSRKVRINTVTIDGVQLTVDVSPDGELQIAGIKLAEGETGHEEAGAPWDFGIVELNIRSTVIDYHDPDIRLETEINELTLRGLTTWATEPAPLTLDGSLNGADISMDGQLPALADGYGFTGSVKVSGLPLQAFDRLVQPAVTELSGRLTLDSRVDVSLMEDRPLQAEQDGVVRLDELRVAQADYSVAYGWLEWQGKTTLSAADEFAVNGSGQLSGGDLDLFMPSEKFRLRQFGLNWDGSVGYTDGEAGDLRVSGRLKLDKSEVDAVDGKARLVGFDAFTIDSVDIQGTDAIMIDNLVISGAALADATSGSGESANEADRVPPLQIANLSFDHIQVTDGKRVSIDTIESSDARYTALRDKDGTWRMATIIESLPFMGGGEQEETSGGKAEPGSLRLGVLENTGMVLMVEDRTVMPPFRMQFNGTQVTKEIDTARPEQNTHIYLKGSTARHSDIEIKGTIRPFASPLSMNLESHIEGVELPPLSSYAIASIGHRLDSGQLDADSTLRVENGQLEGMNSLVIRGLKISPVKGEELEKMQSQLAVPLDKGLDMLRDEHDVIKLKLPITGNLDSPDFDVSDVINQAVAKATKEGAIASLTLLLQPYGSLITVARYAADKASAVHLAPVEFSPASAELDEARHDYLGKVAGIIKKRPGINVRLCGIATALDRDAMVRQAAAAQAAGKDKKQGKEEPPAIEITDAQLVELADQRDAAVKDFLVDKLGVKPGRLVACQPGIDPDEGAGPRVDMLI
jgi:hypothetical protein